MTGGDEARCWLGNPRAVMPFPLYPLFLCAPPPRGQAAVEL